MDKRVIYDELLEYPHTGARWKQTLNEEYTHVCCDCGSSHDVYIKVVDDDSDGEYDSVEIRYKKNPKMTRQARKDGVNGVLMSRKMYDTFFEILAIITRHRKKMDALNEFVNKLKKAERHFQKWIEKGSW